MNTKKDEPTAAEATMPYRSTFISSDGSTAIAYEIYSPAEGAVRAVLQVSHGMCEYIGRYADFAGYLCNHGIALAGNCHRGHGESAADDDELGYFGGADGDRRTLVDDLHIMNGVIKTRFPGVPVILMGHSMGSFVARLFLTRYAEDVDGAIIMGTAGRGAPTGIAIALANIICSLRGPHHRSRMLARMAFSGYLSHCERGCDKSAWLTHDEEIVKKYNADKYCTFIFTVSAYRELFLMLDEVNADDWAPQLPTDMPLLLISGDEDPVGGFGKGVREVAARLTAAGLSRLTTKLIPGGRHEILNEVDRAETYLYILNWINNVLSSGAGESDEAVTAAMTDAVHSTESQK